jgi:hypothetical protein
MNLRALLLSTLAGTAWAAAPGKPPPDEASAEERVQLEQRARLMATMQISEVLGLDDASTLKLKDTLTRWDTQKAPLRQEMFDLAQTLRRAGRGDTTRTTGSIASIARDSVPRGSRAARRCPAALEERRRRRPSWHW